MAVENKYVDANVAAGKLTSALQSQGSKIFSLMQTFEVAVADDDGSVYRVFTGVDDTLVPMEITILHDAITSGTDWDFGLYLPKSGAVVTKDLLADGADLSSAGTKDGLGNVNRADRVKTLYELAGKTVGTRVGSYDLALTANTVGSAAGTVTVIGYFAQK